MKSVHIPGVVAMVLAIGGGIALMLWGPADAAHHGEALIGLGIGLLTRFGAFGTEEGPAK